MRSKRDKLKVMVRVRDSLMEMAQTVTQATRREEPSLKRLTMHREMMLRLGALTRYTDFLIDDINYLSLTC